MNNKPTIFRFPLAGLSLLMALFLAGCTSMPLTTMYKLSRLDPMEADPAQIKVAVRADEAIGVGKGDAKIEFTFEAEDGSLNIDEIYLIEAVPNPALRGELYADKQPGESVTVLALTPGDAQRMRQLQIAMARYRDGAIKGSGSLRINLDGICLQGPLPPGEIRPDIFLQTSEEDGFFMLTKDLDMSEILAEEGKTLNELPDCQPAAAA